MEKIFIFSKFYFTPFTWFFGGIVAEEILKYTGLYKPASQWLYFNFLEFIDDNSYIDNFSNDNSIENKDKDKISLEDKNTLESFRLFGKKKIEQLKEYNILSLA